MTEWICACSTDDIEAEDVARFDHGGRTFAIYRSPDDEYFATDGLCTHEQVHLSDGLVMDHIIECPKHNGRFDYRTGAAKGAPVCVNLATYPVRVDGDDVLIEIDKPVAGMVIIGAGECGTRAALALREAGYAGSVTLVGAEPHPPYERPPLSKEGMTAATPVPKGIVGADGLAAAGVDFRPGAAAVAIDRDARTVRLADGAVVPYERLLIATGARPRSLPGADAAGVAMLRDLGDAARIRAALGPGRRLAVVGGGFIGLELAASARKLGSSVTVIEALPRLLSRGVPAEIADVIEARHRAEGVDFVLGARIAAITAAGVALEDGRGVAADLVVVGIGAVPETSLAAAAGLAVENGIAVDACLATEDPAVFAAGDCASFLHPHYGHRRVRLESWRSAQEHGTLAARNMLGHGEALAAVPWFWSDQYDLTLQVSGLAEGAATTVRRELRDGAFVLFHLDADGRLLAASGIGSGNSVARDIRLAEMMIARGLHPDPVALAAPETSLKKLLAG